MDNLEFVIQKSTFRVHHRWKDGAGFSWGWQVMYASCDEEGPFICVATLYEGGGNHHEKVLREHVGIVDRFVSG